MSDRKTIKDKVNENAVIFVSLVAIASFGMGFTVGFYVENSIDTFGRDSPDRVSSHGVSDSPGSDAAEVECFESPPSISGTSVVLIYSDLTAKVASVIKRCAELNGAIVSLITQRFTNYDPRRGTNPCDPGTIYYNSSEHLESAVYIKEIADQIGQYEVELDAEIFDVLGGDITLSLYVPRLTKQSCTNIQ